MILTPLDTIKKAQKEHRLVLFIGAGVSVNSGYPTWNTLVSDMAQKLGVDNPSELSNYLQVIPQIYYNEKGEDEYRDFLQRYFEDKKKMDNVILDELMAMNPEHIITTNYDCLIEHAVRKASETGTCHDYELVACDAHLLKSHRKHYLIKMHGDLDNFDALVLKEEDYLSYSSRHVLIETFIKSLLVNHVFVFVGYSLQDTTLNMIMSWVDDLVKAYHSPTEQLCSHIFFSNEELDPYMEEYFRKKRILTMTPKTTPKYRRLPKHKLKDQRGVRLLKMLRGCIEDSQGCYMTWTKELLADILTPFLQLRMVHFEDVKKAMEEVDYRVSHWGVSEDVLYIDTFQISRELGDLYRKDKEVHKLCDQVLAKSGITRICWEDTEGEEFIIDVAYEQEPDPVYQALLSFDFETLSKIAFRKKGKLRKNEDALYCAYIMNRKKKARHKYRRRLMHAAQHSGQYLDRIIYNYDYYTDKLLAEEGYEYKRQLEVLPQRYQAPLRTFAEYVKELPEEVAQMQHILLEKLRAATPYSGTVTHHFREQQKIIGEYRYQVASVYRYLVENRINVVHFSSSGYVTPGLPELVRTYIEYLLVEQSPALVPHERYEGGREENGIRWNCTDLHLMFMFLKLDEIARMFAKHHILEIHGEQDVPEYMIRCLCNVRTAMERRYVSPRLMQDYKELIPKLCYVAQRLIWNGDTQLRFVQIARDMMFELLKQMDSYNMQVSQSTYRMLWQLYWNQINGQEQLQGSIGADLGRLLCLITELKGENQSAYLDFLNQKLIIFNMANLVSKYGAAYGQEVIDQTLDLFLEGLEPMESRLDYAVQLVPLLEETQINRIKDFYQGRGQEITANEIFTMVYFDLIPWSADIETSMRQYCIQYMERKQQERREEEEELRREGIEVHIAESGWLDQGTVETNPFLMLYNLYVRGKTPSLVFFHDLLPEMKDSDDVNARWYWLTSPLTFDYECFDTAWLEDFESLNLFDKLSKEQKTALLNKIEEQLYPGQDRRMFEWFYKWHNRQ